MNSGDRVRKTNEPGRQGTVTEVVSPNLVLVAWDFDERPWRIAHVADLGVLA